MKTNWTLYIALAAAAVGLYFIFTRKPSATTTGLATGNGTPPQGGTTPSTGAPADGSNAPVGTTPLPPGEVPGMD